MGTRFDLDMAEVAQRVGADLNAAFRDSVELAAESVTNGSPITGSLGQPVESGELRQSITTDWDGPSHASIGVNADCLAADWALQNEDGIARPGGGPYRLLSPTGGRWSFEKTAAGWGRIVDAAIAKQGEPLIGANID